MALAEKYLPCAEKTIYTEAEYFEFERRNFGRWEYVNGEIHVLSGGTANHSTIAVNIAAALRAALLFNGCRVFGSDMRVHTGDGVNTFPGVSAICGPLSFYRGRADTLANPLLLVEVMSDSTEPYDRGENRHYQSIPTVTDYLLVSQHEARAEALHPPGQLLGVPHVHRPCRDNHPAIGRGNAGVKRRLHADRMAGRGTGIREISVTANSLFPETKRPGA